MSGGWLDLATFRPDWPTYCPDLSAKWACAPVESPRPGGESLRSGGVSSLFPGETEFGHSTPITANQMNVGPFDPGSTVSSRTRVANSNPGFVTSPVVTVVVAG